MGILGMIGGTVSGAFGMSGLAMLQPAQRYVNQVRSQDLNDWYKQMQSRTGWNTLAKGKPSKKKHNLGFPQDKFNWEDNFKEA